jgi:serine phosphatase RsbU (regulator of sigma subunit)
LQLSGSLPLGLTANEQYAESLLQLVPGDSLTFLTDGIVEAQSSSGELFGFERTATISTQSAESIARAAQQDDITVLTLTFAGAEPQARVAVRMACRVLVISVGFRVEAIV